MGEQDVADQQGAFAILGSYISRQFILGCISPCAYLVPAVLTACFIRVFFHLLGDTPSLSCVF